MQPCRPSTSDQANTSMRSNLCTQMAKQRPPTVGMEEAHRLSNWRPVSTSQQSRAEVAATWTASPSLPTGGKSTVHTEEVEAAPL